MAYNYAGQRFGRPHLAIWAEAGLTVAADLLAGNDDVRPRSADLLGRALAAVPEPVRNRGRAGGSVAGPRRRRPFHRRTGPRRGRQRCDFAVAAKQNTAMWRAYALKDAAGAARCAHPGLGPIHRPGLPPDPLPAGAAASMAAVDNHLGIGHAIPLRVTAQISIGEGDPSDDRLQVQSRCVITSMTAGTAG